SVERKGWSGRIRIARSLVILPDSTTSTQTFSSVSANLTTSGVASMRPRNMSPRVHAKIEAIGLVEVGLPCWRSEEHTSELQSRFDLVCRLLLEKKKNK